MTTHSTDRQAVTEVLARLADAWARHDADAYGAEFTEDAGYVTYVGTHYRGRSDIVASHRVLFAGFLKGTRLADELLDVRFPAPGLAVVTSRGDTYKGSSPKGRLTKVQTYTLVRESGGRWRVAAFQNTKRRPLLEAFSFRAAPGLVPSARREARAEARQ
ncbi:SgcJ/EcaC family oxidoreductase [Kitasatospora sp. NPDC051853]|uniref:SgcJ/EcaC family oxidoreductase n=1 Tax=Kitasatospora sp. NPDC051853 TaxID=3364058 RepID=UPI003789038F